VAAGLHGVCKADVASTAATIRLMKALKDSPARPAQAVIETHLPLPGRRRGKVRDVYELPPEPGQPPRLVIVATDRISAFDVVLPTPIPGKGCILTDISLRWFDFVRRLRLVEDHVLARDAAAIPGLTPAQRGALEGRVMVGRSARVVPIECVVRGYVAGSGWSEYQASGSICGIRLAPGIPRCGRLPEPIFTPATKAAVGHDENIDFDRAAAIAGGPLMERLRQVSLAIYARASAFAEARGIILADTKFEFGHALGEDGRPTDTLLLIDEVLTPDSSRFWPADAYRPGQEPPSFDKQYVRNHLQELVAAGRWDKTPPGPELPDEVVRNTLARYEEARRRLFG
jgi:phosphoribosylaminoimidazole-succinocarboxamide synthase